MFVTLHLAITFVLRWWMREEGSWWILLPPGRAKQEPVGCLIYFVSVIAAFVFTVAAQDLLGMR